MSAVCTRNMPRTIPLRRLLFGLLILAVPMVRGATATNFTVNHSLTGQPIRLHDFAGSVVLLDFFSPGCWVCSQTAADLEPNLIDYYAAQGGNPDGIPVTPVFVNVGGDPTDFIQTYHLEWVGDDGLYYPVLRAFGGTGAMPYIVVINGVTNATSHPAWEILHIQTSYVTNTTVSILKSHIDRVRGTLPPQLTECRITGDSVFKASFRAQKGRTNVVEFTTNWTDWNWVTNLVGSNTVSFQHTGSPAEPVRAYRVRVLEPPLP